MHIIYAAHYRAHSLSLFSIGGWPKRKLLSGETLVKGIERRYQRILGRQKRDLWGAEYQPSILASRKEAPSKSKPTRLWHAGFGRDLHLLSEAETDLCRFALHHSALWQLHEQKMISPRDRVHPIATHPRGTGLRLPPLRGSVSVLERLDALDCQPMFVTNLKERGRTLVPYPFVGDLLLFLTNSSGPYCINWNIKSREGLHKLPFDVLARRDPARVRYAEIRFEMESAYYLDGGIRTVAASPDRLDPTLRANLRRLYAWHSFRSPISSARRQQLLDLFRTSMVKGTTPLEIVTWAARRYGIDADASKGILFNAIWTRELIVDLHTTIAMDRPLRIPDIDLLEEFSEWFRR